MDQFKPKENKIESLPQMTLGDVTSFIQDWKQMLESDFVNVSLIDKILKNIKEAKETLIKVTPENDDQEERIKSVLQDLDDLETTCNQRKTLH